MHIEQRTVSVKRYRLDTQFHERLFPSMIASRLPVELALEILVLAPGQANTLVDGDPWTQMYSLPNKQ